METIRHIRDVYGYSKKYERMIYYVMYQDKIEAQYRMTNKTQDKSNLGISLKNFESDYKNNDFTRLRTKEK